MGPSENELRAADTGHPGVTEDGTVGACRGRLGKCGALPAAEPGTRKVAAGSSHTASSDDGRPSP